MQAFCNHSVQLPTEFATDVVAYGSQIIGHESTDQEVMRNCNVLCYHAFASYMVSKINIIYLLSFISQVP